MIKLTWPDVLIEGVTIEQSREWLSHWGGLEIGMYSPIFMNKFGSLFFHRPEGPVEMLDVFEGAVVRVAESRQEFAVRVNTLEWQEIYLMTKVVYKLHETGKIPGPGECYAIAPHPVWSGINPYVAEEVDVRYVMVMSISSCQSLYAQALGLG